MTPKVSLTNTSTTFSNSFKPTETVQAHLSSTNTKASNYQQKKTYGNIWKQTNQQNTKEVQNNTPTEDHNAKFQASNCLSSEHSYAKKGELVNLNKSQRSFKQVIPSNENSSSISTNENSSSISTNKNSKHASSTSGREKKLKNLRRKYGIKY